MPRLNFGAFLAPHHPVGEHPMLQFRRDLDLVEQLDRLGYDESGAANTIPSGWEMIGSPEMFLAAAGRTVEAHQACHRGSSHCPITTRSMSRSAWCSSTT